MFLAPEIILYKGQTKGVDHWSWAVLVYRLVTGKYAFYQKGMDEMALYKRISKGSFEVTGQMSIELRMLLIAVLYPDPTQRLGSRANGWRDIFDAPWFRTMDLEKLRKQALPAPSVPSGTKGGNSDGPESTVHQSSDSFDDLFDNDVCGKIPDMQQQIFSSFGSRVVTSIGDPTA
jgi:serine/threonine protein kinase